jgi:hypothetical protein
MSLRIKEGLPSISDRTLASKPDKNIVARVYGIVMDENTPSKELFEKAGGWNGLGTIFYADYEQVANVTQVDLKECQLAKPLFPNNKYFPLIGELVVLLDLPSPMSQLSDNKSQKYYIIPINLWNNNHHNALPAEQISVLGKTFIEKSNLNTLKPFEGDYILESRFGSTIRFGSTTRNSPWGKVGEEGDPIIIISNGHNYNPKSTLPYVEDINSDKSGLYLTSNQAINLNTGKIALNVLTKPIDISKYSRGQAILVGDRVVLGSKRDDILLIAKTNIELYTKNIINLNAEDRIHLNGKRNFIGTKPKGELPDEPLLLGDKTTSLLDDAFRAIANFANVLSSAVSTPEGTPILQINQAAQQLSLQLEEMIKKTDSLKSKQNFTV